MLYWKTVLVYTLTTNVLLPSSSLNPTKQSVYYIDCFCNNRETKEFTYIVVLPSLFDHELNIKIQVIIKHSYRRHFYYVSRNANNMKDLFIWWNNDLWNHIITLSYCNVLDYLKWLTKIGLSIKFTLYTHCFGI